MLNRISIVRSRARNGDDEVDTIPRVSYDRFHSIGSTVLREAAARRVGAAELRLERIASLYGGFEDTI